MIPSSFIESEEVIQKHLTVLKVLQILARRNNDALEAHRIEVEVEHIKRMQAIDFALSFNSY